MDHGGAQLRLLHHLADLSGERALHYFRANVAVDAKADESPVTCADREAEEVMRAAIRAAFPDHGIVGEEHGEERLDAEWLWILDPIDGTASFINGVPLFGSLIGLWQRTTAGAVPRLGCINHPALQQRWVGGADFPTTLNGAAVQPRPCARLAEATVYATGPDHFTVNERARFTQLESAVLRRRFGGTDCYHYAMVASGWTDMACEAGLKLHDYAAIVPVLQGAGALITDWNGAPLALESYSTVNGCILASGDARIHTEAVALLGGR